MLNDFRANAFLHRRFELLRAGDALLLIEPVCADKWKIKQITETRSAVHY